MGGCSANRRRGLRSDPRSGLPLQRLPKAALGRWPAVWCMRRPLLGRAGPGQGGLTVGESVGHNSEVGDADGFEGLKISSKI